MYVCMYYVCVYVCVYVCMYVCMYVCIMYVCMYVCVCVCMPRYDIGSMFPHYTTFVTEVTVDDCISAIGLGRAQVELGALVGLAWVSMHRQKVEVVQVMSDI